MALIFANGIAAAILPLPLCGQRVMSIPVKRSIISTTVSSLLGRFCFRIDQFADQRDTAFFIAMGQKAKITDFDEALGQYVEQKSTNEFGGGLKDQRLQDTTVAHYQGIEFMGQGKDQVIVAARQTLGNALIEPFFLCNGLAFGTAQVAA